MSLGLLLMFNSISSLQIASCGWSCLQRALKGVSDVDETISKIQVNTLQDGVAGDCCCWFSSSLGPIMFSVAIVCCSY